MSEESVFLGVCDEKITEKFETSTNWQCNKVGGKPDLMPNVAAFAPVCRRCEKLYLSLVCQIYAPLGASLYHRVLYVYACTNKSCWNTSESWLVLRAQNKEDETAPEKSPPPVQDDWGVHADDWGSDDEETFTDVESPVRCESGQSVTYASVTQQGPSGDVSPKPAPEDISVAEIISKTAHIELHVCAEGKNKLLSVPEFVPYYLNVFNELDLKSGTSETSLAHEATLLREYSEREGISLQDITTSACGDSSAAGEGYERSSAAHGDAEFYYFCKVVSLCPQQVIRYQYSGSALVLSGNQSAVKPEPCKYCNGTRQYELQIMPNMVNVLRSKDNGSDDSCEAPLEFGCVTVYTCAASCWSQDDCQDLLPREEWVHVQPDPDQHRFH